MTLTPEKKFSLVVAIQVLIILTIVVFKVSILTGGTPILLKIEPVDPRDLLRGDYVTFRYGLVSSIPGYLLDVEEDYFAGEDVYVILRPSGSYWTVDRAQKSKPDSVEVFLKGTVTRDWISQKTNPLSGGGTLFVSYGIEDYFIPEGEGRDVSFWNKKVAAQVLVDNGGHAVLKKIYINDKPWP